MNPTARDIPWIVSVDDHVVEPPHVWQDRLPAQLRERGPRVVRMPVERWSPSGGGMAFRAGGEGPDVDTWVYEDLVAPIPQSMACAGLPPEASTTSPSPGFGYRADVDLLVTAIDTSLGSWRSR